MSRASPTTPPKKSSDRNSPLFAFKVCFRAEKAYRERRKKEEMKLVAINPLARRIFPPFCCRVRNGPSFFLHFSGKDTTFFDCRVPPFQFNPSLFCSNLQYNVHSALRVSISHSLSESFTTLSYLLLLLLYFLHV